MLIIYNLFLIAIPVICLPCLAVLLVYVYLTPKYKGRLMRRLGFGLADKVLGLPSGTPRIWIHALSVGEVSSARSLVNGLRKKYPDAVLLFSASTRSGEEYAASVFKDAVDSFIPFPLDLFWSTEKFVQTVNPDLFVLVETDLWPNFLGSIRRHKIRSILVNGRMSEESFANYRKLAFFFAPMLSTFDYLTLQTDAEKRKMMELGVSEGKIRSLGNLKYDGLAGGGRTGKGANDPADSAGGKTIWVAGSTHTGEEELLLAAFARLRKKFPDLYLVIAPRNVERGRELSALAAKSGFQAVRRSEGGDLAGDLLILDTLGELAGFYELCTVAFVGGSLVQERGHNPLEPAALGKPVIFGPHMEDFQEIAADLVNCGGAKVVTRVEEIDHTLGDWLSDDLAASGTGMKCAELVKSMQGVTEKHLELVEQILAGGNP
ncbi:MAG: 3-deoxy-D-manno-octulosonic acid transferase [Proteobacteria bacterium]|nr:3-deoxy-D-manno-octulosonic acid transferase [Pseudomonadota bacterium]MBU1738521.1 3-deoxy-D-manno-octulosonic acid transferase [Pseudomonadota bacterium]